MAGQVINLNKARKVRKRQDKAQKADENAVRFGRSKQERRLSDAKNEKLTKALDDHRLDK